MSLLEKIAEMKQICGIVDENTNKTPSTVEEYVDKRRQIEETNTDISESEATSVKQENEMNYINISKQPKTLSGGIMKYYELESLEFLMNIHAMSNKYNEFFRARNVKNQQDYEINAILADEMGLGKTIETLALFAAVYEHYGLKGKHLIVVPKSTIMQWEQEQQKWCPSFKLVKLIGGEEEREDVIDSLLRPLRFDILLTTYDQVRIEHSFLEKINFEYIILDEGHKLKDIESQISGTIRALKAEHMLILTGTPIENNLHELWSLLNCLMPYLFSDPIEFVSVLQQATNAERLQEILRLFLLRREKKEVETLPPKNEYLIHCPMTRLEKKLYRGILMKDLDSLQEAVKSRNNELGRTSLLNILMQLRKCADHPYLFKGVEPEPYVDGPHLIHCAGKMVVLDELIRKIIARNEKVLVFCQMTSMLNIIEDYLNLCRISHCRIDGSTDLEDRTNYMSTFMNNPEKYSVFLLSTRAGCLGLNLTAANHVIIYEQDFNPEVDAQAVGRAYRILEKKEVYVYRLVTENSVDVKIYERAVVKMQLDTLIIENGNFTGEDVNEEITAKATKNSLMEMIAFETNELFENAEEQKQGEEEQFNYDEPEITFDDEKMQELLKNASIFEEETINHAEDAKLKAQDVINKLANDGKLESFDVKDLYQFEGEDFGKQNLRKLTQQMYQERMAKLEEDRLGRRLQEQGGFEDEEVKDTRWYPTISRFKRNAQLYKPDMYLLDKPYYTLQKKVIHEISKVIEPFMAKNSDVTYEQYIAKIRDTEPELYQKKYTNQHLPGLSEEEAMIYMSYCEQNSPFLNGKELSKKDYALIIASLCDYDPSLYPEETGVRRIQYCDPQEQKSVENPVLGLNLFPAAIISNTEGLVYTAREIDTTGIEDLSIAYNHFCANFSRTQPPFTEAEYKCYCEQLVLRLSTLEDGQRIRNRLEKSRQRRALYFEKIEKLRDHIEKYEPEPLLNMALPRISNNKLFTQFHDRFLLIATDLFGYGCWDEVVAFIRMHPIFTCDWWFKSRDEEEIMHRVDRLLKGIIKAQVEENVHQEEEDE